MRLVGKEDQIEALNRQALRIAREVADEGDALMAGWFPRAVLRGGLCTPCTASAASACMTFTRGAHALLL